MALPTDVIPPQTFIRPERPGAYPEITTLSRYGRYSAYEWLIRETADKCQISLLQLGMLVGLPVPTEVYRWTGGEQRPSPVYAQRIHALAIIELTHPGKVFWMKGINWHTGEIYWKDSILRAMRRQQASEAASA